MKIPLKVVAVALAAWAVAATVLAGLLLVPPPAAPEDPFAQVLFLTDEDRYDLGDEVLFILFNPTNVTFRFRGWTVQGLVDGAWVKVECHEEWAVLMALRPHERMVWPWTVDTEESMSCGTLPSVEPGMYRGVASLSTDAPFVIRSVYAHFEVA